ncbi:MAG: ThuA domain-containing protein [Aestuariibacter sp.]
MNSQKPGLLLLYGGWEGHLPRKMAEIFRQRFSGQYDIKLHSSLDYLLSPEIYEFDAIIPLWTQGELSPAQESAFSAAISYGLGLIAWHGSADAFRCNQQFKMMLGGTFISHPGDKVHYPVVPVTNPQISIVDMPVFELESEQYYMHVDPSVNWVAETVFTSSNRPWHKVRMPVSWTKMWGQGRVFYTAIGHDVESFEHDAALKLLGKGIEWVLEGKVGRYEACT